MFQDLTTLRRYRTRRASSWDETGRNATFRRIAPGARHTLGELDGPGIIQHIWITVNHLDYYYPRRMILRAWWDGADSPAIECPLGDFFGVGHGRTAHYAGLMTNMVGDPDEVPNFIAFNCYFPMPFKKKAVIEIENASPLETLSFYYYVDYQQLPDAKELMDRGYFHCQYNQRPCEGEEARPRPIDFDAIEPPNLDAKDNYTMFRAEGRGHYLGCALSIDNWNGYPPIYWFGEGEDMIFIDGEPFPPTILGTGTEDYFNAAWGYPAGASSQPFHGVSFKGEETELYSGQWTMYRHHVPDPIYFEKSIHATIERGQGNLSQADYSSAAYAYIEAPELPSASLPALPESDKRLARFRNALQESAYHRMLFAFGKFQMYLDELEARTNDFHIYLSPPPALGEIGNAMRRAYHDGKWHECMKACDKLLRTLHFLPRS